jgi:AraC-like DNA-binding protein
MDIIFIILLCGVIQGLFLSTVYLFRKHGNRTANKILSVLLFLFSLSIALHALGHKGYIVFLPDHEAIITVLMYLFNPLVYLFIIIQTGKIKNLKPVQAFHFAPAVVIFLFLVSSNKISGPGAVNAIIIFKETIYFLIMVQYFIYTFLSIREIIIYRELIRTSSSIYDIGTLKWIGILLGLNMFTWLIALIIIIISEITSLYFKNWDYVWLFASLYIYLIGYFALNREEAVYVDRRFIPDKYKGSGLSAEKAEQILQRLQKSMAEDRIFLTEDLTITALATELDTTIHQLSQVINESFKMNFSEYINRHRIEEARRLIDADRQLNIAAVAFSVGFNSLSSFNSAFKKFTSTTPSQYKNSP